MNGNAGDDVLERQSSTAGPHGRAAPSDRIDAGPGDDNLASSEVFELNTMGGNDTVIWAPGEGSDVVAGPTGLKFDSNEWAEDLGFTAPPEMEANATAFMPRR